MTEWYHLGESIGEIELVVIGQDNIAVKTEEDTKKYKTENVNTDPFYRAITEDAELIDLRE